MRMVPWYYYYRSLVSWKFPQCLCPSTASSATTDYNNVHNTQMHKIQKLRCASNPFFEVGLYIIMHGLVQLDDRWSMVEMEGIYGTKREDSWDSLITVCAVLTTAMPNAIMTSLYNIIHYTMKKSLCLQMTCRNY
jgi:hypothetical protein